MRLRVLVLLVLCGVSVQACGDDETPTSPGRSVGQGRDGGPDSGHSGPFVPIGGGGDGGGDDDGGQDLEPDSGPADGGGIGGGNGPTNCRDVDPVPPGTDPDPSMLPNLIAVPMDLPVARASASWDQDCVQPALRVTLSSGFCPDGDGHEISFFLPADGVEASTLVFGQNLIMEDSLARIRVRYTRPSRLSPSGQWGTCEAASGTLDLTTTDGGPLQLAKGRTLQATFLMDLTRCDDGTPSVQPIEGSFRIEVPASLSEVCP